MNNQILNKNASDLKNVTITIKVSGLLDTSEASILLNQSENSLRDLMSRGELVPIEVNGRIYFDESELWDWMYNQNPIMIKNDNPSLDVFAN